MTIDKLNTLTDEEVRVRVARALGWKNVRHTTIWRKGMLHTGVFGTPPNKDQDVVENLHVPDFVTDLNAAFTLVEKLRGDLWNVVIANYGVSWSVRFYSDRYIPRMTEDAAGPSLARAICLSFLAVTQREEG